MKTNMYSIEIANIVKQFLTEDSWNFSFDEEHGIFKFGLRIKGKIHSLKYFISIRTNEIIVYGICPIGVDEEDNKMMMEMAEFLHRVNWGLRNGCFEFDFSWQAQQPVGFIDWIGKYFIVDNLGSG